MKSDVSNMQMSTTKGVIVICQSVLTSDIWATWECQSINLKLY